MKSEDLKYILVSHVKWLNGEDGGKRAYLRGTFLRGANLEGADLRGAYLGHAYLRGADLGDADLRDVDLGHADLRGADLGDAFLRDTNLRGAYLEGTNLRGASLRDADLRGAFLERANLRGAFLRGALLRGASLRDADLEGAKLPHFQIPHGELVVWKKVQGKIVRLRIPKRARRTGSLVGRKCRAEYVVVEWIEGGESVVSNGCGNGSATYTVGKTVYPDNYDPDPRVECSSGIHFFLTREEAEEW